MTNTKTYESQKYYLKGAELPKETKTYKPISHGQLIDLTLESIHQAGFKLDKESYSAAKGGNIANGKFSISNVADSEMQLQIGWQNSYDKSLTLKFAIGTNVFICANGVVSGDHGSFKRKHIGDVQIFTPNAITEYIKLSGDGFIQIQKEREIMKHVEIDARLSAELVGRMIIQEEFIQSTQLIIIQKELKKPTYDYKAPGTLWELYQHTTHAMKEVHPSLWMQNHIDAHNFFVTAAGELEGRLVNIPFDAPLYERRQLTIFDQLENADVV